MTAPIDRLTKDQLLDKFQAKSGCMHTQDEAERLWVRLVHFLSEQQRYELSDSWVHFIDIHADRKDIDIVCGEIRKAWRDEEVMFWMMR